MRTLLDHQQLHITLHRLAHQVMENHTDFSNLAIVGLQPRGVLLSDRILSILQSYNQGAAPDYGRLDITFYRDDVHRSGPVLLPAPTDIQFSVQDRTVLLIDDVLHTGRTIRAAMDALLDFGRPSRVQLLVLIDRRYSREVPVQPDYTGRVIDTIITQKVKVQWGEQNEVLLLD